MRYVLDACAIISLIKNEDGALEDMLSIVIARIV